MQKEPKIVRGALPRFSLAPFPPSLSLSLSPFLSLSIVERYASRHIDHRAKRERREGEERQRGGNSVARRTIGPGSFRHARSLAPFPLLPSAACEIALGTGEPVSCSCSLQWRGAARDTARQGTRLLFIRQTHHRNWWCHRRSRSPPLFLSPGFLPRLLQDLPCRMGVGHALSDCALACEEGLQSEGDGGLVESVVPLEDSFLAQSSAPLSIAFAFLPAANVPRGPPLSGAYSTAEDRLGEEG